MMPSQEKTFVEIVQEMIGKGVGFDDAVKNLVLLGLNRKDAQRLVDLLQEKETGNFTSDLKQLVRKKIIAMKEARKIEGARRVKSKKAKQMHNIKIVSRKVSEILARHSTPYKEEFQEMVLQLLSSIEEQYAAKRNIRALLTDFSAREMRAYEKRELDKAIKAFNP